MHGINGLIMFPVCFRHLELVVQCHLSITFWLSFVDASRAWQTELCSVEAGQAQPSIQRSWEAGKVPGLSLFGFPGWIFEHKPFVLN